MPLGPLLLISEETGKQVRVNITTKVGKSLLATFAGDEAKYADNPVQFSLLRDSEAGQWLIEAANDTKNPTYLDGAPLEASVVPLTKGAPHAVTIGPDKMRITLKEEMPG